MQDTALIDIAKALDDRDRRKTWNLLLGVSAFGRPQVEVSLLRTLIRRALAERGSADGSTPAGARHAASFLEGCIAAIESNDHWLLFGIIEDFEGRIDAEMLNCLLAAAVAGKLGEMPVEVLSEILRRVFAAGRPALLEAAWRQVLREASWFVPDFWLYQAFIRSLAEMGEAQAHERSMSLLEETGAEQLAPLFAVYRDLLRQSGVAEAMERAAALEDPEHRRRIALWALGASQTEAHLPLAVQLHDRVAGPADRLDRQFMQARLATSEHRWLDVLEMTEPLVEAGDLRHAALCLRALALAHERRFDAARAALDHIRLGRHAPAFLVGRAALIDLTRRLLEEGVPLPGDVPSPALSTGPGRPLAQSLWIGPRLRWIERLSMQSYLANGWRYQLFAYDPPENVPEGVELMDAAAILPRDVQFTEGAASGLHRGSVGAFSDLFRYALLAQRGGLWTDTDVINLDLFEPAGARFVSTEISDAGVIGPNGAMMAAPAGCDMQTAALVRAWTFLGGDALQFARIGPILLAEMFAAAGPSGYSFMPPSFLNPLGWMETGTLLEPFDHVAALPVLTQARNVHVYTETWRLVGLDLSQPPGGRDFLSRLAIMLEDPPTGTRGVRELLGA